MKLIALDIDDVIAGFTPHAFKYYNIKMPDKVNHWCVPTMDKYFGKDWYLEDIAKNGDFWRSIPPIAKPSDITFELHCYISSFPEKWKYIRERWLHFHGFPNKPLIISNNKRSTCLDMAIDYLIDDKPETIKSLENTFVKGIQFVNYYSDVEQVGDLIIKNLKEVEHIIK